MAEAREEFELPFVAEVLDSRDVGLVSSYADVLRIGTRNMSNFTLLAEVGRQPRPVQLKRGFTATLEEWLNAAEYIYKEGNHQIILVERGIRTFETAARNTLDITAVPLIKGMSHLPILVDPSHSGGRRELVAPLARAGVAAGADGIMVDVHPTPDTAKVDGAQAVLPAEFAEMMVSIKAIAAVLGRVV
jgi:3-deoxy-7-phosphoheptulonate synthase